MKRIVRDSRWTNASRANRAFKAMSAQDYEGNVCDLLADLHHYCDINGLDFAEEDRRARGHYLEELGDRKAGGLYR